jgi:tetratricopeptide (TPR) repeat protein
MPAHQQREVPVLELPQELNDRAIVCARVALRHEERGEYERAIEALAPFWSGSVTRPVTEGLLPAVAALVMLRVGSLTAWIGSKKQIAGWQEAAKNLLSEAADLSQRAGNLDGWIEARRHLGICYRREGAFDEARAVFSETIKRADVGSDRWLDLHLNLAVAEGCELRFDVCLGIYRTVAAAVDATSDQLLKAKFHNGRGMTLKRTGDTDRAIIELTAASYYFQQSGHSRYQIHTENNLANALARAGQHDDAHAHLKSAERLARQIGDAESLAQVLDSRALVHLSDRNFEGAERAARQSVAILGKGDEHSLLVDSLVTHARSLARLRDNDALPTYVRAYELAAEKIGSERAGRIALEIISECAGEACLTGHVTMDTAVDRLEASIISAGLVATGNRVTETAMRLGLSQQNLSAILKTRHKDLKPENKRKARQTSLAAVKRRSAL